MSFQYLKKLLGDTILSKSGVTTNVEAICGKGRVIGLYFSASWCPSCIAFTPDLIQLYNNVKCKKDNFEIVYVSSDKDDSQFQQHFNSMPWYAMSFSEKDRQLFLARKFHVQGIPSLILLDGDSGEVINPYGKACVVDDPQGIGFPWKLRDPVEVFRESKLVSAKGEEFDFDSLSSYIKGLYFSAHWCPPCRAFTPILVKLYKKLLKLGQKFEVIFISSDRSVQSYEQYFSSMPWLSIPYCEEEKRKELVHLYGVEGIPSLVILDEENNVITRDGRTEVNEDPEGEDFPWRPKLVDELVEKYVSKLNEEPCLILLTGCEEKELEAAHYMLLPVAEEYQARTQRAITEETSIPRLNFFYGGDAEICDSVRDIVNIGDCDPYLVILDIPEAKKYVYDGKSEVTTEVIRRFVRDFLSGKLVSKPIET